MTEPIQPTRFALEGAITIDAAGPVNTSGAFCDLYTGTHPIAGKVALKMPRDSSYSDATMKLIESEAGVWIKLNHPRILKFLGLYTINEVIYLVSPFAEFGSLPSYLQSFPDADRGRFVIEIAEGLLYLHQFEPAIVHGDVKGNNVLVASDHHARLCDFGLARHVDALTETALKGAGSIPWQSPEIWGGENKTLRSDVYAFGITIYEVLSGKVPYSDYRSNTIMKEVLFYGLRPPSEPPSAPDGTSYSRFWSEATRCWSDNPWNRPSMADVLRNLTLSPSTTPMPHHLGVVPILSSAAPEVLFESQRMSPGEPSESDDHPTTTLQHPDPVNAAVMADATEPTSQNVFEALQIIISLSPVPGIAAVATLVQECYRRWERIKLRKSEVRELCEYGANVVMVINEHAQKVPYSNLEKPLNALKGTLIDMSKAIDLWCNYGNAMDFLKNDEILAGIRKYRSDLAEALSVPSLQQLLNKEYWNQRFEAAGEADRASLAKINSDIAALGQKKDRMQQYFANYRPYSREDPDGSQLSKVRDELFALRSENKDELVVPKREIEGEVLKIGGRPAHAGSSYDIWKGVWLGEYSVALKVFRGQNPRKKDTDRVDRQIDLWMCMRHPNILRLYGVCTLDKGPNPPIYFVSPWMKYRDAVTYCKAKPSADRLRLIYDVAKGLEYLHDVNIMHGGLQGSNVLVTLEGSAVLSDFSLSKVLDGGVMFTQSNGPPSTLRWMSPEAHNQGIMTDQSDVYSWGMTALEILSLQIPFYKVKAMGQLIVSITLRNVRPERADYQGPDITDPIWALFVECWKPATERPTVERLLDVVGSERQMRKGWIPESTSSGPSQAPQIQSRIHNGSGSATATDNQQQASFIQDLASIQSISMPSTQHIVHLILALGKTAPTAIRNKHQLYQILIISRNLCYHLYRVAHTRDRSSSGLSVLEQCWDIMDNLERILLEFIDIVSQETVPFGALSIATWNQSRAGLSRIYGKLIAPPFDTCGIDNSASAMWDRYFDDCSWLSLLLLEGIEIPARSIHSATDEEGFSIKAQNSIERLNHLVNETKLKGYADEPVRELFIKILSDIANVMMSGPDNLSEDFWNAADGALQDIDPEKDLNQDQIHSLSDSWSRFADHHIQRILATRAPTPTPSQDPIAVSLPQELTRLDHEITPAVEPLVLLLQSLGRGAPTVTRNKHKIYAIVSRARGICDDILAIGARPEVSGLENLDESYSLIDALEGILLDVARLLTTEQVSFGREMSVSWIESREEFYKILNRLHEPPFRLDLSAPRQALTNNLVFDDYYWLSLLLEEGIEKEFGRQYLDIQMPRAVISVREGLRYLENEIKCGHHEETTRELVISIATRLYETLSASVSEKEIDNALPIRSAEPSLPIALDSVTLITALSIAFSFFDLESSLESQDIRILADNWRGISHTIPRRSPRNPGETTSTGTGSSGPAGPEGHGDYETPQGLTDHGYYRRQLHNTVHRRKLVSSTSEMGPHDEGRNKNWIVTIQITGEGLTTLSLTGMGLSKSETFDAVSRLALIVLGEIVGEE